MAEYINMEKVAEQDTTESQRQIVDVLQKPLQSEDNANQDASILVADIQKIAAAQPSRDAASGFL
ncbi:hypothetical protein CGRA01v4_09925 [Colletotrichum graminicola]|uniref:Uncharacterized protein n=1 Tax=Colletotrichum graminicola (strain M1.001 / M2 / FGSC 10212) TaxID=645133 RepID=E3QHQ1_COLGM|nr:uncharacterized protein GLRG_05533 [Colletotrichum graminicola M1.001]EFQ30389.1 hypothetical protein GLRG_05533 [Colletotrichum graminicola M1.001]WDK18640.1 hypothetical protein CGRA01v4_09925 [Colletotrichum graminicola]